MKFASFFLGTFLSIVISAQTRLEGYIHDRNTGIPLQGTSVTLLILDSIHFDASRIDSLMLQAFNYDTRYDTTYKKLTRTTTNSSGYFAFDSLGPGIYELKVFHRTKEKRPGIFEGEFDFIRGIRTGRECSIEKSFILHVSCEYDSTASLTHCPKCKKEDKVLPIRYGLVNSVEDLDPNYYYNGYCVIERCHATKRCMRCKYEF